MKFKNEYLNTKLEPKQEDGKRIISKEELQDMILGENREIEKQFDDYNYKKEDNVKIEKAATSISFSYRQATTDEKLEMLIPSMTLSRGIIKGIINSFTRIRIVENFNIENKSGDMFNVHDIVGNDFKVIIFANKKTCSSFINTDEKIIAIGEDLTTAKGILNLLHEVGHYQDFLRLNTEEIENIHAPRNRVIFPKKSEIMNLEHNSETLLRSERNAWAHALKNIRPFAKELEIDIDNIKNYAHKHCLSSYSEVIRKSLTKKINK